MRWLTLLPLLFVGTIGCLRAESASTVITSWDHATIEPMKTSIYFGSVTLTTSPFERKGSSLESSYAAKVFPWVFWNETGSIKITFTDANLAKLAKGETAEFTGDASNEKNKPRTVTGRVQPADATSGKMKVRISADGIELIFNGVYKFSQ